MQDVTGKVAFITGGASGMGLGMAQAFTAAGMKVVVADIRQDHLDEAMALLAGAAVHPVRLDVADRTAMAAAAAETVRVFGKVHVLVNNAAIGFMGTVAASSYDDWDWVMGVNLGGVFNGVREFLPHLRAHGEGGHVVSTASMGGIFCGGNAGVYNTSKHAVVGLMEALREELGPEGIGASVFCPGLVNTNIHEAEHTRPAHFAQSGYVLRPGELAAREEFMKTRVLPAGMTPLEVGERVLRGIRNNDLYILSHPEYEQGIRERYEAILASVPHGEPPPPPERVAAEARVLRNPIYSNERDRKLAQRQAAAKE
ncbi:MAG: hypothetical protein RJB26_1415 [Pseudomonadota bacterium]|jgi:NAD(P)-dependent dehydrogenase (short-subunit alcohol dehydrogenase family)